MKKFIYIILPLYIVFFAKHVKAQSNIKKDTLYILVDAVSLNSMITVNFDNENGKFYTIHCPCLKDNTKPVFRSNTTQQFSFSRKRFNSLTLTPLPKLIELVKASTDIVFNNRYALFFIDTSQKKYIMQKASFLGGEITTIN